MAFNPEGCLPDVGMSTQRNTSSPKWIKNLLFRLLDEKTAEASLGDLEEKFQRRLRSNVSRPKAILLYVVEALGFLRMVKAGDDSSMQTNFNMINHTLVFFTRLVKRDSGYYLVSILGLSVSLVSFLLISMFVRDELSFDKFHTQHNKLYRVSTHLRLSDVEYNLATTAFPLAPVIQSELKGVSRAVRIFPQQFHFENDDKKFEERVLLADGNFFEAFTFSFVAGDRKTALSKPGSVVLTEDAAAKYFGLQNAVGKTLKVNGHTIEVSGVVKNVPEQSHIKFDAIMPLEFQLALWKSETGLEGRENKWFWIGAYTYVLLQDQTSAPVVQTQLASIVNKYFPERYRENGRMNLQPITEIHLNSNLTNELEPGGKILYVRLFSMLALVIMVVSAINLINLSWFKISARIRELGVRKYLGQNASKIVSQLCIESIILGTSAYVIAMILAHFLIGPFNRLVQKPLDLWSPENVGITGITFALIILISIIAVIRPAIRYAHASGYWMLQNYTSAGTGKLRNMLIGLQVGFSFVLLVFSFIVGSQIDFFRNKDLGFDKNNVVVVELNEDFYEHLEAFKSEVIRNRNVISVAGGKVPGTGYDGWRFVPEGGSYEKPMLLPLAWVDHDFIHTLKIKLLSGENFSPDKTYDSLWPFIINRSAALELGWAEDPINRKMEIFAPGTTEIMAHGIVIGIIDDYHFESLHNPVKPVVLTASWEFGTALIRISGEGRAEALDHIEETWKKFSQKVFVYEYLDKSLDELYANETKLSELILFFTIIALYLTCYGMFAMSSLLFRSRLREVAIRKVFGANHLIIIRQFYSRYALFNIIAIIVSLPLAVYLGNLWLDTFPYHITLTSGFFIKAGMCIVAAGLLSVSFYLMKIAYSNPIKFLRRD